MKINRIIFLLGVSCGLFFQSFGILFEFQNGNSSLKGIGELDNNDSRFAKGILDSDIKPLKFGLTEDNPISIFDWKARLHTGISNSFFIDYITSPLGYIDVDYTDPNSQVKYTQEGAIQTSYISQYTIGFVPRYNLFQLKKNMALAVSAPLAIGFGNASPSTPNVLGSNAFGNFQLPLLFSFFYGAESTFDAEDRVGFNLGCGLEFNKIGVVHLGTIHQDNMLNRAWFMPTVSGGIQFYKGRSSVEVNIKYGFGKIQDQLVDQYGNRLSGGRRLTRASSLKLSAIYFLKSDYILQ